MSRYGASKPKTPPINNNGEMLDIEITRKNRAGAIVGRSNTTCESSIPETKGIIFLFEAESSKNIDSNKFTKVSIQRIFPEKYTDDTIKKTVQTSGCFTF